MNAVNLGEKRERGSGVGGNSKSRRILIIPRHLSCMVAIRIVVSFNIMVISNTLIFNSIAISITYDIIPKMLQEKL